MADTCSLPARDPRAIISAHSWSLQPDHHAVVERAKKEGLPLEVFTVHELRRTGSTLLNELGFNSDWIEKCLAHEEGRSSGGVFKAIIMSSDWRDR